MSKVEKNELKDYIIKDEKDNKETIYEKFKRRYFNGTILKILIWIIILIIISGETAVIIHYKEHGHFEEQEVDYIYFDKFSQLLKDISPNVYSGSSYEFMRKQYETWYTNKGYASIIIDSDDNLTTVYCLEDTIDMLNYYLLTGELNY